VTTEAAIVAGIDLGGTNVRIGLVEGDGFELTQEEKFPSRVELGHGQLIERLAEAISRLGKGRVRAVGIGVAGLIDAARGYVLFSPNFPGWVDVPLGPGLERATGLPVAVENDANAVALGEYRAGAGQGARYFLALTLGTGLGGGFVFEGKLFRGATGQAGEVGHMIVMPGGALCGCGRRGCLETIASATGLVRMVREELLAGRQSILKDAPRLGAKEIDRAAREGDELAIEVYIRMGRALGLALANMFNTLDLDVISLGGGVVAAWELFMPALREQLDACLLPRKEVQVVRTRLGDSAGILGAAGLALDLL
jgi:glucokinase